MSLAVFQQPDERPEVLPLGCVGRFRAFLGRRGRLLSQPPWSHRLNDL